MAMAGSAVEPTDHESPPTGEPAPRWAPRVVWATLTGRLHGPVNQVSRLAAVLACWSWVALLVVSVFLFCFSLRFGPGLFGVAVLLLGLGMYFTPILSPGPYLLIVPGTATVIAGVLLLITIEFLWPRLELLLYLWPLVFPIGVGMGFYAWACLDGTANDKLHGAKRTALICVRVGLGLCWILVAWAYIVLNVQKSDADELLVLLAIVIVSGAVVALLMVALGSDMTWKRISGYGRWLRRLQSQSRLRVADGYKAQNRELRTRLEAFRQAMDGPDAPQQAGSLQHAAPAVPLVFDEEVWRYLKNIWYAAQYTLDAAHQLDKPRFTTGLKALDDKLGSLQDALGTWKYPVGDSGVATPPEPVFVAPTGSGETDSQPPTASAP
jgi:hypothetical protein